MHAAEQRRIVAKMEQLMGLVDAFENQLAASRDLPAACVSPARASFSLTASD